VAQLIRVTGNWDLAEECAQDAFAKALERWPRDGIPTSPAGWLKTTARNRALDQLRRTAVGAAKLREVAMSPQAGEDNDSSEHDGSGIADDRLRLMFTCCHPALPLDAQVALTLPPWPG
jgi:RNA polymerase sigma-70 factor, ECF subfamily